MSSTQEAWQRSLLEISEAQQAEKVSDSCKRRLRIRNTDEQVKKKIRDNCSTFTETNLDVLVDSNGMTDRAVLARDTRTNREGNGPPMGLAYYRSFRNTFGGPAHARNQLLVLNPAETVRPELEYALQKFRGRPSSKREWSELFRYSVFWTHRELIGNFRVQLDLNPNTPSHLDLIKDCMGWVRANDLDVRFPNECEVGILKFHDRVEP